MTIDTHGNQHRPVGSAGAGEFAAKNNSAPAVLLTESSEPFAPSESEVRAAMTSVELRTGEREVSDATARTIAQDALANIPDDVGAHTQYPMLHRVADDPAFDWQRSFADTEQLHRELGRLYSSSHIPHGRRTRVNALFTFALHGGDND